MEKKKNGQNGLTSLNHLIHRDPTPCLSSMAPGTDCTDGAPGFPPVRTAGGGGGGRGGGRRYKEGGCCEEGRGCEGGAEYEEGIGYE